LLRSAAWPGTRFSTSSPARKQARKTLTSELLPSSSRRSRGRSRRRSYLGWEILQTVSAKSMARAKLPDQEMNTPVLPVAAKSTGIRTRCGTRALAGGRERCWPRSQLESEVESQVESQLESLDRRMLAPQPMGKIRSRCALARSGRRWSRVARRERPRAGPHKSPYKSPHKSSHKFGLPACASGQRVVDSSHVSRWRT
jgi:hypothetical protein